MKPEHLQQLNPEQLKAVEHRDGPLLIFAGAGSGKTRVLTRRIAHLILCHDVRPSQIFAVTFTNKAAQEMRERVQHLFNGRHLESWISTFHASAARILRQHASVLGFTPGFAIYDSADTLSTLKRVYKLLKLDPREYEPKVARSRIDRAKNNYIFPDDIRTTASPGDPTAELFATIYAHYQQALQDANAMDFGDLICNAVTLLEIDTGAREQLLNRFRYFLVDEYQDTNLVQYRLMKHLASRHQNICVVGDDDQSIYAFRGANIENIFQFQRDYPEATVITLKQNYRSTKTILSGAGAIIAKNSRRHEKRLTTDNPQGESIMLYSGHNEEAEAQFIVREIIAQKKSGTPLNEIAIFYRTNAQSRSLEEAFCEIGLPYQIFGSQKFYERKEIKDILAYYRLLLNLQDNEAFLRIVNTPTRGIGTTSVASLIHYATKQHLPLLPALQHALSNSAPFVSGTAGKKFEKFATLIAELQAQAVATNKLLSEAPVTEMETTVVVYSIAELLKNIADKSGYLAQLRRQDSIESESRIENIHELFNVAVDFVKRAIRDAQTLSLYDFIERTSLSSDLDKENTQTNAPEDNGYVSLMTLHLAKGLEFDCVFLSGMEEGLLPHSRALNSREELEEERRLCYVGMTRAKQRLYMTRALSRVTFGQNNWSGGLPSRFIYDIPDELISEENETIY